MAEKPKPAEKIEAQLQEQKALIAKLSSLKSKEERATLMKQLESLNASVQAALREQKEAAAKPSPQVDVLSASDTKSAVEIVQNDKVSTMR